MITNIAAYHFVAIDDPPALAQQLKALAIELDIRGTVLVAPEGLNTFVAGSAQAIEQFLAQLCSDPRFAQIAVKVSYSDKVPFARLRVKVKPEIITFRHPQTDVLGQRAPAVAPADLSRWLDQGCDDQGKPLVLLDTRNREEVAYGTFENALTLPISRFTDLPQALAECREQLADATVVSFCTGGIRCEKAALWMHGAGMTNVLQLDGGILGYFETVGGKGYRGSCFVFDERVALTPALEPIVEIQVDI